MLQVSDHSSGVDASGGKLFRVRAYLKLPNLTFL